MLNDEIHRLAAEKGRTHSGEELGRIHHDNVVGFDSLAIPLEERSAPGFEAATRNGEVRRLPGGKLRGGDVLDREPRYLRNDPGASDDGERIVASSVTMTLAARNSVLVESPQVAALTRYSTQFLPSSPAANPMVHV